MAHILSYLGLLRPRRRAAWSIGIYSGTSPVNLGPHRTLGTRPVLTSDSLGGISASGVADPFMVRHGNAWLMFFEIENRASGRGEIGLATSADALSWRFEAIVLKEPFHLSYPHVWQADGTWYMVPESGAAGAVRLYRAEAFPFGWKFQCELIRGDLADATPFRHVGRWWIMALEGFRHRDAFVIHFADRLEGPWRPHRRNPIFVNDRQKSRPAGRMIDYHGTPVRFAQDCADHYGRAVTAFAIDQLTPESYAERPIGNAPMLGPTGAGWNATGMHHVDAHEIGPNEWIACVDGRRTVLRWPVADRMAARIFGET